MGNNYYAKSIRTGEELHIGKTAKGWTFTFQGYSRARGDNVDIKSFMDWLKYIQKSNSMILDEYRRRIKLTEFISLVTSHQKNKMNYCEYIKSEAEAGEIGARLQAENCFLDNEGYSFIYGDFS
jgi:hypothetical protein